MLAATGMIYFAPCGGLQMIYIDPVAHTAEILVPELADDDEYCAGYVFATNSKIFLALAMRRGCFASIPKRSLELRSTCNDAIRHIVLRRRLEQSMLYRGLLTSWQQHSLTALTTWPLHDREAVAT